MSDTPHDLKYTKTHEWVRTLPDGTVEIGISDHAQHALGDLVYVELPAVGRLLTAAESCAVVESVKAASDIYSPLTGEVVAVNTALADSPELINKEPYGAGWMLRVRPASADALSTLDDAAAYAGLIAAEAH